MSLPDHLIYKDPLGRIGYEAIKHRDQVHWHELPPITKGIYEMLAAAVAKVAIKRESKDRP